MFQRPIHRQEKENRKNKHKRKTKNKVRNLSPNINNYIKYTWSKYENLETASGRVGGEETSQLYIFYNKLSSNIIT